MTAILADYTLRCREPSDIYAHLSYLHARASRRGVRALELGVRTGNSTAAFLAAVELNNGQLWSVDLEPPIVPDDWWSNSSWTFTQGDDLDPQVAACQPRNLDVLFIDSSHRYRHTIDELNLYGPRVRRGGVILLHDTELEVAPIDPGPDDFDYPVRRAVEDWCRLHFRTPEFREGCYGLGVIEVT